MYVCMDYVNVCVEQVYNIRMEYIKTLCGKKNCADMVKLSISR